MHQSYNFKAVSLMKKRITVFKVSNDFHTQKHRVWHQKQVSCIKQSWISTPWSGSGPPTSHSSPSDQSEASENGPKWFLIPQNIGFAARTMSLECSEAELEFNILKYFLTSYSPSTQFLAFRSIWGEWKWSQMISHTPKHWVCHQNHVSSMLRSWITPQVEIHFLKSFLTSYSPSTQFLALRSIWGFWKWSYWHSDIVMTFWTMFMFDN